MKKTCLVTIGICVFAIIAHARAYYDFKCMNDKCKFKVSIGEGPTKLADYVCGYCKKCDKLIEIEFKTKFNSEKGPDIIKIWDPINGTTRELFHCPNCKELIFSIKNVKEIKYCPKCNSDKIEISDETHIDD